MNPVRTYKHTQCINILQRLADWGCILTAHNRIKSAYNVTQEIKGKTECSLRHSNSNNFLSLSSCSWVQAKHRFPSTLFKNYF